MPPLPQPAHQTIADRHEHNALVELIARLEQHVTPAGLGSPDWYDWISLPLTTYLHGMRTIRAHLGPGRHHYLEVGSGIGTKLVLAHALGFEAMGIEHHQPYVDVSRALAPHCRVIYGDALHDGPYYQADIIYNYSIATDQDHHHEINELITEHMRRGAVYFTARHPQPDHLQPIAPNVWTKP